MFQRGSTDNNGKEPDSLASCRARNHFHNSMNNSAAYRITQQRRHFCDELEDGFTGVCTMSDGIERFLESRAIGFGHVDCRSRRLQLR